MPFTKAIKFVVGNGEIVSVAKGLVRIVFSSHNEDLEAFPSKWLKHAKVLVHILQMVESIHNCVELELDVVFLAPGSNLVQLANVVARSSSNFDVCSFVEGVAADGQNVDIATIFLKKWFFDQASIGNNRDRFELKSVFAEIYRLSQELWVEEWFSASKVDLLHPRLLEEG